MANVDEPNCPEEWVSFLRFTGDTVGDFSQGLEVLENLLVS